MNTWEWEHATDVREYEQDRLVAERRDDFDKALRAATRAVADARLALDRLRDLYDVGVAEGQNGEDALAAINLANLYLRAARDATRNLRGE